MKVLPITYYILPLCKLDAGVTSSIEPPTCLAALLHTPEEMIALHSRLKLSAFERDMALFVINHRKDAENKGISGIMLKGGGELPIL